MLIPQLKNGVVEAGCDEAGRGCLAGPVFAAAVILPIGFSHPKLNDSKQLSLKNRNQLKEIIEKESVAFSVGVAHVDEIDTINILNASILAMHRAIDGLSIEPQHLAIDGNKFTPYHNIPHRCVVKGDAKYLNIAAASILAKTYRDDYMGKLVKEFPVYLWQNNKGYPTKAHREAIKLYGITAHHRKSFRT